MSSNVTQTTAAESVSRPVPRLWFSTEIQHMMHGLGDCRKPLVETAALIEDIVYQQMVQVLFEVEEIASQRNARLLGIEDFLFLFRRDKTMLRRLLRYLDFRDLKASVVRGVGLEDDTAAETDVKQPIKKRRKICIDFLSAIDGTGELIALLDDNTDDEIKYQRKLRAELMARQMDTQQYMDYCEARQASFTPKYKSQKFRDWLLSGVTLEIKPNPFAVEILSYLAYETVAELVDLALIVKRDKNVAADDPLTRQMAPVCTNYDTFATPLGEQSLLMVAPSTTNATSLPGSPSFKSSSTATGLAGGLNGGSKLKMASVKKKKKPGQQYSRDLLASQAIQPSEVREAMRRFAQSIGPFADFRKQPAMPRSRRLLIC